MTTPLVAVTDHAAERYRQRVRGTLDARGDVAARVASAWAAGAYEAAGRGEVRVRDLERPDLVYVCLHDRPRGELVVITLWEEGARRGEAAAGDEAAGRGRPAVPRRFTDALRERRRSPRPPRPSRHSP